MNQEKFGKFIREIRKKNNLTQKQFAEKYNVTYQAVSKWENGLNMPDTSLIKQISKDFDISLEELFDGEYKVEKEQIKKIKIKYIIIFTFSLILFIFFISQLIKEEDFKFKTLSTDCEKFNISGNIAYNDTKTAIYINNIKYCGGDDTEDYKSIKCVLYETHNGTDKKISTYQTTEKTNIKLEDFLQEVVFTVDDYEKNCKEYKDNTLHLSIEATTQSNKIIIYKIPLKLIEACSTN